MGSRAIGYEDKIPYNTCLNLDNFGLIYWIVGYTPTHPCWRLPDPLCDLAKFSLIYQTTPQNLQIRGRLSSPLNWLKKTKRK